MSARVSFRYADVPWGQIHYAECGSGLPILCLHQTPRSVDEYREVLPLLGARFRAIAMDTPGMGSSSPVPQGASIEAYADAGLALADALGLERFSVIGHHTGGVIAVRLAAIAGQRVDRLALSSTPYVGPAGRQLRADRPPIDEVQVRGDGAHLQAMWQKRQLFYPPKRPDLLARYVTDALRANAPEEGHLAVARYRMEDDIGRIHQPVLLIAHRRDPYAFPEAGDLANALPQAVTAVLDDGMVPLEFTAAAFAEAVLAHWR